MEPPNTDPLMSFIQQKRTLIITSNGRKSSTKLGGGLVIADKEGGEILSGSKPHFGDITQINSYRAEIYGVLSVFILLERYCNFYRIELKSPIQYYCDNNEFVTKMRNITDCDR